MYTFIAYKPDSDDYCRGCHMCSYASDFISEQRLDREELVREWANVMVKNENTRVSEKGYEVQVYENGILIEDEINGQAHYEDFERPDEPDSDQAMERYDTSMSALAQIEKEAQALADHLLNAKKQEKAAEEAAKASAAEACEKERRRQQFERLKSEFQS